ncbi:MAG: hypothetical protein ACOC2C_06335 [Cyclonatronaceae bacterium]
MQLSPHQFHIPVMGIGFTIDSPLRVAHLGINSVVSIVDDLLLEKVRRHYCKKLELPYKSIPRTAEDGRARRISAYLDIMQEQVERRFEDIMAQPMFQDSEKDRYFNLLPPDSPLFEQYKELYFMSDDITRAVKTRELEEQMRPGEIQVNIMSKVDVLRRGEDGLPLPSEFSDASAALRGFAQSKVEGSVVLSAGFNPRLYSYLAEFDDFYRQPDGSRPKRVILKVSDFRSALIQGKFLAKKGIEVAEFRIESGINCGGHAFASEGIMLPSVLEEFRDKRGELTEAFLPLVHQYYEQHGRSYPEAAEDVQPAVTVQGGIGTSGEMQRMLDYYEVESTGWGSPFLLVPEATCVDDETMKLLSDAGESEFYLSNVSPLGVPFNNVRNSNSEKNKLELIEKGKPGSKCPKGYLSFNTEFTEEPICTASSQFQLLKIAQIKDSDATPQRQEELIADVLNKDCLCHNLGTSALIRLGELAPKTGKQAVCPGPNLAWFRKTYSLNEMVDHIYGRRQDMLPENRPHMFAKEMTMYADYAEEMMRQAQLTGDKKELRKLNKLRKNLEAGMDACYELSQKTAYEHENLDSLQQTVYEQRKRLDRIFDLDGSAIAK